MSSRLCFYDVLYLIMTLFHLFLNILYIRTNYYAIRTFCFNHKISIYLLDTHFHASLLKLCAELCPKEVEQGVAISSLSGILVTRDNKMTLNSFTSRKS